MGLPQAAAGEVITRPRSQAAFDTLVEQNVSTAHAPCSRTPHGALVLAEPAAGEDLLARKPARIVGSEKDRNRRDIAGLTDAAERSLRNQRAFSKSVPRKPALCVPSVSTMPGLMVLTRIFFGPNSRASTPVIASTAPLVPV